MCEGTEGAKGLKSVKGQRMASIALCPKCSQHVALPDRASGEVEVRCPLCQAEYRLAEAQAIDVPPLEWIGGPVIPDVSSDHIAVSEAIASSESGIELSMPDELALTDEMATDDVAHALAEDQSAEPTEHDTQRFALDPATSEHASDARVPFAGRGPFAGRCPLGGT
ncbi:MAG: hypothetical protein K8T25_05950 [Planctomycetia bacterium]|nr:hypothetical protein [Planctomycetia bacterium]